MANRAQRYNPELQRRSLERRKEKQEDFDNFVGKLKEYSKSDKPGTPVPFTHQPLLANLIVDVSL